MAESRSSTPTASDESRSASMTGTFLAVAAITTIVGFAAFFATWLKASIDPGQATLEIAGKQYALGHYLTSAELARQSVLADDAPDDQKQLREYLIGASLANEALLLPEMSARRTALHEALPYLQAASTAWPLGREDDGDRLLGLTLFNIGAYKDAIRYLKACVGRNPTFREELSPTLARCYLYGEKDAANDALKMLDQQAEMLPAGSKLLDETQWLRAECLLRLGRFDEARETLKVLEEQSPKDKFNASAQAAELATRVKLLLAITDVSEAIERFGKGISEMPVPRPEVAEFLAPSLSVLESLRLDATPEFSNQASLWAARAYGCEGDAENSLSLLAEVRQQQPFTGANIAAGIEELEWLAGMGNGEEALQTVRYLLREIGSEQNYDGSLVDLESFRARVIAALQSLRQKERFKHCVAIAQALPTLLPETDAVYEEAITYRAIADQIISNSQGANKEIEPEALLAAKQEYRKAGDAFAKSAKLRFDSKQYCDTLWEAIEAYQLSGQFELCVELLENYLRYEQRSMQPRALLAMGKARLATGEAAEALLPLVECIVEFPRDPLRYDARLAAALSSGELNRFDDAKKLLDANLSDGGLTPESIVWRDSLYALGDLLFREGHEGHLAWGLENAGFARATAPDLGPLRDKQPVLEQAVLRLGEASTRYWPDARAKHSAYLAARANKLAAVWPRLESESPGVLDVAKRQLRLKADQHLNLALNGFINLRRDLALREEEANLTQAQQAMLRNCYVEEADTLFELGKYEQAAEAFRAVSLRYMNEPTALEAMLGQARCLERLERPREARMIIRQATVVLGRIPPEADPKFLETTRYDRKRWQELLAWLDSSPLPDDNEA